MTNGYVLAGYLVTAGLLLVYAAYVLLRRRALRRVLGADGPESSRPESPATAPPPGSKP